MINKLKHSWILCLVLAIIGCGSGETAKIIINGTSHLLPTTECTYPTPGSCGNLHITLSNAGQSDGNDADILPVALRLSPGITNPTGASITQDITGETVVDYISVAYGLSGQTGFITLTVDGFPATATSGTAEFSISGKITISRAVDFNSSGADSGKTISLAQQVISYSCRVTRPSTPCN